MTDLEKLKAARDAAYDAYHAARAYYAALDDALGAARVSAAVAALAAQEKMTRAAIRKCEGETE
jgi:hypothetical protein